MSGCCVDALNPAGCPSADELRAAGADGVRLVAFDNPQFFEYAQMLLDEGLQVAIVLARESFGNQDYGGFAAFYAERLLDVTFWVLGNEMDAYLLPEESPSSWSMRPAEYAQFWNLTATAIRERQPEAALVVGGLVSGQPWWASGVAPLLSPPPDAWDIHPYGKGATDTEALLDAYLDAAATRERLRAYRAALRSGVAETLILEWNRPAAEIAEYELMLQEETSWATYFCWSDGMVPGFGLVDAAGVPTPSYEAFREANEEDDMPEVNDAIKATMEEFEEKGGTVGTIYTVVDLTGGYQVANTDAGLFVSQDGVPGAQILLDARAKNPFR